MGSFSYWWKYAINKNSSLSEGKTILSHERSCPWVHLVSRYNKHEFWTMKTYLREHTYFITISVKSSTSTSWLTPYFTKWKQILTFVWGIFQKSLKNGLNISKMKVFRARARSKKFVYYAYERNILC